MRRLFCLSLIGLAILFLSSPGAGVEKLRYSGPIGMHPFYILPYFAALDKGVWSELGLEVTLSAARDPVAMYQAISGGHLEVASNSLAGHIPAAAAGVPAVVVADMGLLINWVLWVMADSPFKEPADLKGAKIGVTRFLDPPHMFAMTLFEAVGLGKEYVQYISMGGIRETTAALRAGAIQGTVLSDYSLMPLVLEGRVRAVRPVQPHLPQPWIDVMLMSEKGFAAKKREVLRRFVTGFIKGAEIVMKERDWALAKMIATVPLTEELARRTHPLMKYVPAAKIDPRAIENVRNYLINYKVVAAEKTPPADELYLKW